MFTVIFDSYSSLEATLAHMKNMKLEPLTGEILTDCYKTIVSYKNLLDSTGALNTKNLDSVSWILEDSKDFRFYI